MRNPICSLALGLLLLSIVSVGCEDFGVIPPVLPSVVSFTASPTNILEGQSVQFRLLAAADNGLARGIIDYRDGTKSDTVILSGNSDSAQTSHPYLVPGIYKPTLTLEDASGQKAVASDSVYVRSNQLPQIISGLAGTEGAVSRAAKRILASDPEGDPLTISVSPVSPGLIFHLNATGDTVIYYLADRDDNGTKQAKITVVDQKNRTVERVINVWFSALDDIRGRVLDRFEGTHLAFYNPAAVMQGPYTGWVTATTGGGTVKVSVDADGIYAFPKLPPADRTLRAFITNGRDSSFVVSYPLSSGDHTFDVGVETNAGTNMPLGKLLSMYQLVNFRTRYGMTEPGTLNGINLRNMASNYFYYLLGRDTMLFGLNTRGFTREQQDWLVGEIQARCFAHLPPGHRPIMIEGGLSDPVPVTAGAIPADLRTKSGYAILYADPTQTGDGWMKVWEFRPGEVYDGARIGLKGGDVAGAPYGFSIRALVQKVGCYISGAGVLGDAYYNDKSTRAESTVLDRPSIADMKLDWQVVFETPRFDNYVEAKYFEMPH
jgi:hypothetical protein